MEINAQTFSQTTAANSAVAGTSAQEVSSDFETFLKMLTVQMQNQDPLNPVDSSDYAVQLATFSGVEQQAKTNSLLEGLAEIMGSSGMAQMAAWVGKEARAPANGYFNGDPITIAPNPVSIAESAQVIVRNADGVEVERFDVPISADPFVWTGMDADGYPRETGLYSFEIESYSNGELLSLDPVDVYSTITEVRSQGGETILILSGGVAITASQVSALRDPSLVSH
jgi:flagellar basal-body rod modification protein FlgD